MTDLPKPIRTKVRRVYVPEAIYFITTNVWNRKAIFARDDNIALLRQTMREVKKSYPFHMRA